MAIQAQMVQNHVGFPLWGSQDWILDTGIGGIGGLFAQSCLDLQQKQMNPTMICTEMQNDDTSHLTFHSSLTNSGDLEHQIEMQSQEIDRYIGLQSENLRVALQNQINQQVAEFLKRMEMRMFYLLSSKDKEIFEATKKRAELEDFLVRLEAENQAWQRIAKESEAKILSLHNTIEEMKERAYYYSFNNGLVAEDVQSCCEENRRNYKDKEEEKEEKGTGENRAEGSGSGSGVEEEEDDVKISRKMMTCRNCNYGRSCFLFLPCRHLCSCQNCEAFLDACPVCRTPKAASIEALVF